MSTPTDQHRPTDRRRAPWLRFGRSATDHRPDTDRPATTDRRPTGDRPATTDRRPPTGDHRPDAGRPPTADRRPSTTDRDEADRPQTAARSAVDERARRAQLTAQTGAAGLPTGYGLVFGVLVAGSVTAGLVSFLFSFGNVRWLNIWLGLPGWIQPLVSPAVDLSVIVLVVVIQYLTLAGAPKKMLRSANVFLVGAGIAMLGANVAPSLILGLTAPDPAVAGRLYGRAIVEAFAPAALVCWAHVGPGLVRAFAWVRNRADQAALAAVELRTLATETDRAQAAADRKTAADLVAAARLEADHIRAAADQARAEADRARQAAADQATADRRAREIADQAAADQAAAIRRQAERDAQRLTDQAAADQAAADQAARLVADRERALADRRREIEAAADQAAADRRAAAELLAEAEATRPEPGPPGTDRPTKLHAVPSAPTAASSRTGRAGGATQSGGTADELARERAEKAKAIFTDWETKTPSKRGLMDALRIHGEAALAARKILEKERLALTGERIA